MKIPVLIFVLFGIQYASAQSDLLLPKINNAIKQISNDDYKAAKSFGKIDVGHIIHLVDKEGPPLLGATKAFSDTAKQLRTIVKDINLDQKDYGSVGIFTGVSKKFLNQLEHTITNLSNLFSKLVPQFTQYVSNVHKTIKPWSVTPNGYLKLPKSFIRNAEALESQISADNIAISKQILVLVSDLQDMTNDLNQNSINTNVPESLLNQTAPILESLSDAYKKIGNDIHQMMTSSQDIRSVYKKSNKGTCYFVPIDKLVRVVTTTVRSIAKSYTHCGNLMNKINQQLSTLETYLKLVLVDGSM